MFSFSSLRQPVEGSHRVLRHRTGHCCAGACRSPKTMSNKYGISNQDEREIRARDKACVYCRILMKPASDIFRMLLSEKRTVYAIARELNRRGIAYSGTQWDYQAVYSILTHPKYCGCQLFGRTSRKLCTRTVKLPRSQWCFEFADASFGLEARNPLAFTSWVLNSILPRLISGVINTTLRAKMYPTRRRESYLICTVRVHTFRNK